MKRIWNGVLTVGAVVYPACLVFVYVSGSMKAGRLMTENEFIEAWAAALLAVVVWVF